MVDVTDATFETDVLERSVTVPVVVDLWAEWCGPCKQLGPMIEAAVEATQGAVTLAKIDVDSNPRAAATFSVQSIPAVYALKDRKIVANFIGAQSRPYIDDFIAALLPSIEQTEVERLLAAGDEGSLRAALELEADNPAVVCALAELLARSDRGAEALTLLARIPETAEARHLAALARMGEVDDVAGQLDGLLDTVRGDDDARQRFVDLLELMGPDDPRTSDYRRKLMGRLY